MISVFSCQLPLVLGFDGEILLVFSFAVITFVNVHSFLSALIACCTHPEWRFRNKKKKVSQSITSSHGSGAFALQKIDPKVPVHQCHMWLTVIEEAAHGGASGVVIKVSSVLEGQRVEDDVFAAPIWRFR